MYSLDVFLSQFGPVHCSKSGSNCCFLSCIQASQETGKVVWYSYLFMNFPQFVMIHKIKGFSVVNEAEVDVFLEFPCFFYDPMDVGNLFSGSSAFSESNLYICKVLGSWTLDLAWMILGITLLACEMSAALFNLVPWPGIKPLPPALEAWSLNYWTTGKSLILF